MEMFCNAAGIKLLHVPYRGGGPALAALLGGQVALTAQGAGPLKGYSDEGKLRVLATFGAERHSAFPDAPTLIEAGYDNVVFYVWAGLFVPKGVPADAVGQLRRAVNAVMNDPQIIGILNKAGSSGDRSPGLEPCGRCARQRSTRCRYRRMGRARGRSAWSSP
jgi:tripartite-type tricarboxylate transporter receptor subunit TctC